MRALTSFALIVFPAMVLFGCQSTPELPTDAGVVETPKAEGDKNATAKPSPDKSTASSQPIAAPVEKDEAPTKSDTVAPALKNIVYFGFDEAEVKSEYRETVRAHAAFLAKNPNSTVTIEGHCDERGTREYNIALGDRRANSVRQMLMLQGVSAKQISTISYGEERPVALGHDEASWGQNRRGVFVYVSK